MISVFKFLSKNKEENVLCEDVLVDVHSHLLPNLDDGSESVEESLQLIGEFINLGYKKLILTPHIMGDFFRNTPEMIHEKLELLKWRLSDNGLNIQLHAAAEYYLDESFLEKLKKNSPLLTLGNNYLLFETSYINSSSFLDEAIFLMKSNGYKPVLAHPERYTYLYSDFDNFKRIYDKGVLFQLNLNSISGYYSKAAQVFACKLIENQMVDMLGSDCHGIRHIDAMKKSRASKQYKKALQLNLINNKFL
ncbi:MAG: tyrosine-protein phosphatase [Cytophagaceae bacterium]